MATQARHSNRIPSLDGVRGLAVLLVFAGHFWKGMPELLANFGVQIFFVLSGYLITTLLQQERERTGAISWTGFYQRRALRIFPAAFAYILLVGLIYPESRYGLPEALTYTVSWRLYQTPLLFLHLWSLSVEEHFYLLWPLALIFGYKYRGRIAWSVMALAAAFRFVMIFMPDQFIPFIHYSFPGTMDSIAAGCLLAIYQQQVREKCSWMAESPGIAVALPFTAWILSACLWGGTLTTRFMRSTAVFFGVGPLLLAIWLMLMMQRKDWIFNNPVASAIGVLSYSLYLWQSPFSPLRGWQPSLALPLVVVCAVLSYFLVEKPALRLGAVLRTAHRPVLSN